MDTIVQIPQNPPILIGGSSYFYRAYHVFPPLTNSADEPTSTMHGVLNILCSLITQYKPIHAVMVSDAKGKTFRDKLFEHYKSHRPPIPNSLRVQTESLRTMVKTMGLPLLVVSGVEADDIIDTLARGAEKAGCSVLTSTGDKNMAQLVAPNITLINAVTNTVLGPEEVVNKYGMPPELIIGFLALMGDSSDNIPDVPGIDEKTAQALLQSLGGLDTLYAEPGKIAGLSFHDAKAMAAELEQNKEVAYLSYQLATVKTDVELELTCEQLEVRQPTTEELLELFKKYEFKHQTADVEAGKQSQAKKARSTTKPQETSVADEAPKVTATVISYDNYITILDGGTLKAWIAKLEKAPISAFDTETDSLDNVSVNLVGLSFAIEPGVAAYIPVAHDYLDAPDQISCGRVLELLKPLLRDEKALKIGQNLKYDRGILASYGTELREIAFNTMLESYILNSVVGRHDMGNLTECQLKHKTIIFEGIAGEDKSQLISDQIALEEARRYAVEGVDVVLQLHLKMRPNLQKHKRPLNVFENIEMPLVSVFSRIERNGVKIDLKVPHNHSKELTLRLAELEKKAHGIAGEESNLSSTKQLQTTLFGKQGIESLRKTPGGTPSMSERTLKELALDYPLPKVILEYRGLTKLKSTYTGKLPLMINPKTGRVHTSYHQAITTTGCLSSTGPNLQNIPVHNGEGHRIRQAFIAPEDYMIVSAGYSQIELCIMAHLSRGKSLLTTFAGGKDIRRATVAEVFDLPLETVTSGQRRSARAINFGLIYGISAFGLARQLNIPRREVQKYIDLYFECYPGVLEYMEHTRAQAKKQGYVEALDGRRLYLPGIKSSNGACHVAAERTAINAPMQRTTADIIKRAMIAADTQLQTEQPRVHMIMQVHDELVFEVHKDDIDTVAEQVHQLIGSYTRLDVPLLVEVGGGENWDQAH